MPPTSGKIEFRLLQEFRKLFEGRAYVHRASTQGDFVAMHLYEDLVLIDRSPKLVREVEERRCVLNVAKDRKSTR